jgi:hypothetical protein
MHLVHQSHGRNREAKNRYQRHSLNLHMVWLLAEVQKAQAFCLMQLHEDTLMDILSAAA